MTRSYPPPPRPSSRPPAVEISRPSSRPPATLRNLAPLPREDWDEPSEPTHPVAAAAAVILALDALPLRESTALSELVAAWARAPLETRVLLAELVRRLT
jgi:hypothetical protein